jgi:hypothetical protein
MKQASSVSRASRRALVVAVTLSTMIGFACLGTSIDVGTTNSGGVDAQSDSADAGASAPEDAHDDRGPSPLGQCAASGQIDRYYSAKELTARLVGRWGQCPHVATSPLPCLPKTAFSGIRFSPDGTFSVIGAGSEYAEYVDQPETCGRGTFRIFAPAPTDGGTLGDGAVLPKSEYVAFDDAKPRNGLEVHLQTEDGVVGVELVEFEMGPERMFLREQAFDTRGYFARLSFAPR